VNSNTVTVSVAQVGGVLVAPDQAGMVSSATGQTIEYGFDVTNTGNGSDWFDLSLVKSGPYYWPAELLDTTGTILMAQDSDADGLWDYVNPAYDSDSDGRPDTGTLAAGASLSVVLRMTVPAGTNPGDQEITSLMATSNYGPISNQATATSTPVSGAGSAVIVFDKSDSPDPAQAGSVITYTLTYRNTGNRNAIGVVILDSIAANTTYIAGSAWNEAGVTVEFSTNNRGSWGAEPADPATVTDIRWTVGDLVMNSGDHTAGFQVQPSVALPDGSIVDNSATFQSDQLSDITASASTAVRASVAFTNSTKVVAPTLALPGATLTYTIDVTNDGSAAGNNVVVTDLIPAGTTYVASSITGPGADDSGLPTLVWNLGTVGSGASVGPLTFQVTIDDPVAAGTFFIDNTATVDSDETNPATTTTASTSLSASPFFVGSTKMASDLNAGALQSADTIAYRIEVVNSGNMDATGVVISDTLPADTTYVPGSITGLGADDALAPDLSWNIGNLAAGASTTLTFRVTVNGGTANGTLITNLADIDSDQTAAVSTAPVVLTVGGGATGTIQSTTPIVPTAGVTLTVADVDLNTDPLSLQSFSLTTTNTVTGETEQLTYTETGLNTGVFTAAVATVFGVVAGTDDDGTFNVQAGDMLSTDYDDALTASGGTATVTAVTVVVSGGVSGTLVSTTPIFPGDAVTITLTDADLNADPLVAESLTPITSNSSTGESELLTYTETGIDTGVFTASVNTVFGLTAGVDNDGAFNVQAGETLVTIYNDAVSDTGGPAVAIATTNVQSAGVSGTISATVSIVPTEVIAITVTDADLNTNSGVAETTSVTVDNPATGESETVTLTETGLDTGVFSGTLATSEGVVANPAIGVMAVDGGDAVTSSYDDAIGDTGGPVTVTANTNVYNIVNISVDNVTLAEGDSGTTDFIFTVTLDASDPDDNILIDYTTNDGTAADTGDYTAARRSPCRCRVIPQLKPMRPLRWI
jgi:uncharacterized repeat protein (TIGR01451 family)